MRRTLWSILAYLCLLFVQVGYAQDPFVLPTDDPQATTLASETANNTGACVAANQPSYCTAALPPLNTSTANQNPNLVPPVETIVVDAPPKHVSTISLHRFMDTSTYTWPGKVICEYQPWFSTAAGYDGHILVGYDETNTSTVANQDLTMISRGCDVSLIDYYGHYDGQTFIETATTTVATDLQNRVLSSHKMQFGILEDQHAMDVPCGPFKGNEGQLVTCLETSLIQDMNYIHTTYASNPAYWLDGGTRLLPILGPIATGRHSFQPTGQRSGKLSRTKPVPLPLRSS
jgi:hypothetical protein